MNKVPFRRAGDYDILTTGASPRLCLGVRKGAKFHPIWLERFNIEKQHAKSK